MPSSHRQSRPVDSDAFGSQSNQSSSDRIRTATEGSGRESALVVLFVEFDSSSISISIQPLSALLSVAPKRINLLDLITSKPDNPHASTRQYFEAALALTSSIEYLTKVSFEFGLRDLLTNVTLHSIRPCGEYGSFIKQFLTLAQALCTGRSCACITRRNAASGFRQTSHSM